MSFKYFFLFLLFPVSLFAQQAGNALPEPLTLEYVLSLANDQTHYDVLSADALVKQADSSLQSAESAYALESDLTLKARWADPSPLAYDQAEEDHLAVLSIRKPLYDFGKTSNNIDAAEIEYQAMLEERNYQLNLRKIDIAKAFFDVVITDYKERWDNEQVVLVWVDHEAEKDRLALGEVSDVEVLKIRTRLRFLEKQRSITRSQQLVTRSQLAEVINRPGELSSDLELPDLKYHKRKLPDYEKLVKRLEEFNHPLKLQAARLVAAEKRMRAMQMQNRPTLSAEVTLSEYERQTASNNDWAAELKLTVPLFESQGMKADASRARSDWLNQRSKQLRLQSRTRQRLLTLYEQINLLLAERKQLQQEMEYNELELDRKRALYEMEVSTNFGDAMVAVSRTRYMQLKTDYQLALAWMNLELMFNNQINFDGSDNE